MSTIELPPRISVLMPIFNAEHDLREAVESILSQSYENFEFIVINDGSTDHSAQIINSYHDDRIRVINLSCNLGLVEALNLGVSESRGEFIARMDGDDVSGTERLNLQLHMMQTEQLDICGSHWENMDSSGRATKLLKAPLLWDELVATLATTVPYAHGTVMLRKSFLEANNLNYNLGYGEDYRLWIECFERGAKFGAVNQVLYRHREHINSISTVKAREQARASKVLRRNFARSNLSTCEQALTTLKIRFKTLSRLMQVHALYMAYRIKTLKGKSSFYSLLMNASLPAKLHFIFRMFRA